jgi:hypothetical protein
MTQEPTPSLTARVPPPRVYSPRHLRKRPELPAKLYHRWKEGKRGLPRGVRECPKGGSGATTAPSAAPSMDDSAAAGALDAGSEVCPPTDASAGFPAATACAVAARIKAVSSPSMIKRVQTRVDVAVSFFTLLLPPWLGVSQKKKAHRRTARDEPKKSAELNVAPLCACLAALLRY